MNQGPGKVVMSFMNDNMKAGTDYLQRKILRKIRKQLKTNSHQALRPEVQIFYPLLNQDVCDPRESDLRNSRFIEFINQIKKGPPKRASLIRSDFQDSLFQDVASRLQGTWNLAHHR